MTRYAVIGASSGTGRQIVRCLADKHVQVRAISRRPPAAPGEHRALRRRRDGPRLDREGAGRGFRCRLLHRGYPWIAQFS